jgi:flagellar biogenesis protein FliO
MTFRNNMLQLEFPNSRVWPRIEKKFSLGPEPYDSTMMAYQFDSNLVRFRAFLPFNVEGRGNTFSLEMEADALYLKIPSLLKKENTDAEYLGQELDEKLMAKLLIEKGTVPPPKKNVEDKVSNLQASVEKREEGYSLMPFIGKFAGFLAVVLFLFFVLVGLFKKGIQRGGIKGFLNSMNAVEILSTTYIAPKKNLLLVKVYKQILLLGVSDSGISFLTEIHTPVDFLRNSEEHLTGKNFDKSLDLAQENEKSDSKEETGKKNEENLKESPKERVMDHIRNKIKQLKPLQ